MRQPQRRRDKMITLYKNELNEGLFGRVDENGNISVLDRDGYNATRIFGVGGVYPVGSEFGLGYEHPEGITLTADDAAKIGLDIE